MIRYDEYTQLKKNERQINKKLWECLCCFFGDKEKEPDNEKSEFYITTKVDESFERKI